MGLISLNLAKAQGFVPEGMPEKMKEKGKAAQEELLSRGGRGNEFTGWIDLPEAYDRQEFERIQKAVGKIRSDSDVLLVIGIGGSYLGARAAIEFLGHSFYNELPKEKRGGPEIYFLGNQMSGTYAKEIMDVIDGKDFSINIISKSESPP